MDDQLPITDFLFREEPRRRRTGLAMGFGERSYLSVKFSLNQALASAFWIIFFISLIIVSLSSRGKSISALMIALSKSLLSKLK